MKITSDIYSKQMKTALPELVYQRPKTSEKKAMEDTFSRKVEEVEGMVIK